VFGNRQDNLQAGQKSKKQNPANQFYCFHLDLIIRITLLTNHFLKPFRVHKLSASRPAIARLTPNASSKVSNGLSSVGIILLLQMQNTSLWP